MRTLRLLLGAATALWWAGCTTPKKTPPVVDQLTLAGHVLTTDNSALPDDAVLTVRLLDVSSPDDPAGVVAEQSTSASGRPPIGFMLRYRPAEAERGHRFVLDARIESMGKLRYYSLKPQPVKLDGTEGPHELLVAPAK
ncbi:YbaY family lipoprotein [Horticoccus luteus]|uniref:YbaY family lipoprotein n=1 Tax=Horticoccus luteus TaxID=2862869 RepID=A0A8F9TWT8_9BACT|nr:YbaY family lipoprotein [Horticoccus luteus]QYM79203.1 YbaY family lipoprotein [Horticoccus luteus]